VPSSDGVVDALAAYAAAEIGDTHELDREGIEVTAIYEAVEYAVRRRAERIEETALHERVSGMFHQGAARSGYVAAWADEYLNRPAIMRRW
jgi:hypothetical protein